MPTLPQTQHKIIPATDAFDIEMATYFSDNLLHIRESLNDPKGRIDVKDYSYRIINHWENNGLFELKRGEEGSGWRRFSAMDKIWLKIIGELRLFGVSVEKIRAIREFLETGESKVSKYPLLEFYCAKNIAKGEPSYFLVFSDFSVQIASESDLKLAESFGSLCNHIRIDLGDILQGIFPKMNLSKKVSQSYELNNDEIELVLAVRTGFFREIKIELKNGKIYKMEKELENPEKEITKILKEGGYQTITIQMENGKVRHIKQIKKQRL